jgi:hypothetical protein
MDFSILTKEQQQNLSELLRLCRFLIDAKKLKMADSAISYGIDMIAKVVRKLEQGN